MFKLYYIFNNLKKKKKTKYRALPQFLLLYIILNPISSFNIYIFKYII